MRRLWPLVTMVALLLSGLSVVSTSATAGPAPVVAQVAAPVAVPVAASVSARADSWVPKAGVAFNKPRGSVKARTKLIRRVIGGIKHAPKGSTIRFAMYSFDRRDVPNALLKAHKRGVNIQMIVNDNWTSPQTVLLRRGVRHKTEARRTST